MSDTTYNIEIIRSRLEDYTNRVQNEEAGASKFIDSRVASIDSHMCNVVTFEEQAVGQVPDPPTFVKLGQLPAGKQAEWTGVVLIDGRNTAVQMFR